MVAIMVGQCQQWVKGKILQLLDFIKETFCGLNEKNCLRCGTVEDMPSADPVEDSPVCRLLKI